MDSALSEPPWKACISITRFVFGSPIRSLVLQTHLQEITTIGNKVEDLHSRVVALEEQFDSHPGDVEELKRREEVISYAIVPPHRARC